uniref:SCO family protein n=1 Tax=Shinella sumterensis TaxID=1967501 RepID=UPI003F8786CA
MTRRRTILGLCVLAAIVGATVAAQMPAEEAPKQRVFRLETVDGTPFGSADLAGRPYLVFFGFTHCPDICPTTLFELSEAFNALGDDAGKINALFVTVDPARDTPEALARYLSSFNPRIRGLTGDQAALEAMLKAYRGYARRVPLEGEDYTMDHTAVVYL